MPLDLRCRDDVCGDRSLRNMPLLMVIFYRILLKKLWRLFGVKWQVTIRFMDINNEILYLGM